MNRTIKFQLSNVKHTYLIAALLAYGAMGLFYVIAVLFDQGVLSSISNEPIWLTILSLIAAPFTFLGIMYALFDGLMFFDSSIRFGISRTSYFITQMFVFIILTLLLSFATGMSEVEWTGTASTYFTEISTNFLSIENLVREFIEILIFAVGMLAIYRFKWKAFIPVILLIGSAVFVFSVIVYQSTQNTFFSEWVLNTARVVLENKEIFVSLLVAGLIGAYYLFVTRIEVQD